jgi:ribosome-associated translation inhibitor RaiA
MKSVNSDNDNTHVREHTVSMTTDDNNFVADMSGNARHGVVDGNNTSINMVYEFDRLLGDLTRQLPTFVEPTQLLKQNLCIVPADG